MLVESAYLTDYRDYVGIFAAPVPIADGYITATDGFRIDIQSTSAIVTRGAEVAHIPIHGNLRWHSDPKVFKNKVLSELAAGSSAAHLERKYSLIDGTVRAWSGRAKKSKSAL